MLIPVWEKNYKGPPNEYGNKILDSLGLQVLSLTKRLRAIECATDLNLTILMRKKVQVSN